MRIVCFALFLVLVMPKVNGQSHTAIDSIKERLRGDIGDTARLQQLNDLAWEYFNYNLDTAEKYAELSKALAVRIGYLRGEGAAYETKAVISYYQGNFHNAMLNYDKDLSIKEELIARNTDTSKARILKHSLSTTFNNIGVLYMGQGYNDKALDMFFKSLKLRVEINSKLLIADTYNNIGIIYHNINDIQKALSYYLQSLKVHMEIDSTSQRIGAIYMNIGIIHKDRLFNDSALFYYKRSLHLLEAANDLSGTATVLGNMADVYRAMGDQEKAFELIFRSLKLRETLGERNGMAINHLNIGHFYLDQGKPSEALEEYHTALGLADSVGSLEIQMNSHLALASLYAGMKRYKDAYAEYKSFANLKKRLIT